MDTIIAKAKDASLKDFGIKKLGELQSNKTYPINSMSMINTKYGMAVLCELHDTEDTFSVFLPKRYADVYKDLHETIASLQPRVLGLTVTKEIKLANGATTYALNIDYCQR